MIRIRNLHEKIRLNRKNFLLSLILSLPLALFSSAYTEEIQMSFWKGVKNFIVYGTFKRGESESGVLFTIYNGDRYVNPVHVTMRVLLQAEEYLSDYLNLNLEPYGSPKETAVSITEVADFLIKHYDTETIRGREVVRLDYQFDYPIYDLKAPWYSGMAQGHAAIVFLAAYLVNDNEVYLDYARKSVALFHIPTTAGGVMVPLEDGSVWLEEYADPKKSFSETPKVLNGHIFAVDGLFYYWYLTRDPSYRDLLIKSILAVNDNILKYDTGFWSYYGLKGNYAHAGYHKVHIKQLSRLNSYANYLMLEGYENLPKYFSKFEGYSSLSPLGFLQRMICQRNNLIYIIYISNLFLFFLLISVCVVKVREKGFRK
tara:strand:- start:6077 stop:7189 length:1113 start_codon:yes stop_codon:yes gene_type:complete